MKMDKVANSKNDEFYTPEYAIRPILKYIQKDKVVWCPFDTEDSHFVKMLRKNGNKVVATHISTNQDFFLIDRQYSYDIIISNPPYSLKADVIARCFALGNPFALLVDVVGLFESKRRFNLFKQNKFEVMYFDKRISYFKDYADQKPSINPPFSSVYVTQNILPQQIVFEEIDKSFKRKI